LRALTRAGAADSAHVNDRSEVPPPRAASSIGSV